MPKTTKLLPGYLIVGTDAHKRAEVIARLRKRVAQGGDAALDSDMFNGEAASADDIVSACQILPFVQEYRLIVVNGADRLKKADASSIATYLKSPNITTILALVCDKMPKNSALYKSVAALGPSAVIDCAPRKRNQLVAHVVKMAASRKLRFTDSAAAKLISLVGEDTIHIDSELEKLQAAFGPGSSITETNIASYVAQSAEAKPWQFLDAFSERDIKGCLKLRRLMPSVSSLALLGMCTNRIKELMCTKTLQPSAAGYERLAKALSSKKRRLQGWQVKNHFRYASKFTSAELQEGIVASIEAERQMKSGTDPDSAFEAWYLAFLSEEKQPIGFGRQNLPAS